MKNAEFKIGKYRHYRTQQVYQVLGLARHTETHEEVVVYQGLYHCEQFGDRALWVRPLKLFLSMVEHEGQIVPRFTWLEDA